ncbi:hypothetical protein Fmac_002715 [Flemingia macrophylla]|uniref:PPC domain-containing protein n=1 Tax=Flemingia macrophylla TaxID=520843 RepID=A0ABD1NKQ8_9FABA
MEQPIAEVPPPFAAAGSSLFPAATGMKGSNQNVFRATVVEVDCYEDVLEKITPYAGKNEIFILGGSGEVSFIELVNLQKAPVANTVLQGNFDISAMEGNVVAQEKNKMSQVTVLVAGTDGRIRGGPVRSLIAKSSVKVIVSTRSKGDVHDMVSKGCSMENEHPPFEEQAKHLEDVVDQIYMETLKELNETSINTTTP